MNQPDNPEPEAPGGDPWAAFGYLVAGVGFYGVIGWLLSIWLHAGFWIPVGILVGLGLGLYLVFTRYAYRGTKSPIGSTDKTMSKAPHDAPESSTGEAAQDRRPATDDRGETA